ncbi:large ribosomal subunit protein bL9m [Linepithema humile]|uniref:large ribosomal subunit protein bL9m n=1 Tax=Linepithema humile TaxID=83485 RepID=UPI0006234998|nr:PREDICTED: 39S ribosomal protein L9, mitochondrial [Linepithema humile]
MLKFPRLLVNHVKTLATPTLPNKVDCLSQQTRNTFILKRRHQPSFHKKNCRPKHLKTKHYIYDLVEDTNTSKQEPLDLILTQYVAGLGSAGTRVTMRPKPAYSTLLLPKLADYATPENIEKYSKLVDQGDNMPFSSASVEGTIKYLSQKRISIVMSKDMPWTLEKWHIRTSFRKAAIYLSEDTITMPEKPISGPNLEIEGKEFFVTLTINNREQVKVRCCLHHWTPDKAAQICIDEFWKLPTEPIFPENKPILDSLPAFWVDKKKDRI